MLAELNANQGFRASDTVIYQREANAKVPKDRLDAGERCNDQDVDSTRARKIPRKASRRKSRLLGGDGRRIASITVYWGE